MSSIASPTTTTRRAAIFANSCSRWSRVSRASGVGVIMGGGAGSRQRALALEPVADADAPQEPGPCVPALVLEVRDAMRACVERHADARRYRVAPREGDAPRTLHDALKDRRRSSVPCRASGTAGPAGCPRSGT